MVDCREPGFKRCDIFHIFIAKLEIEDVKVFFDALLFGRFGDCHNAALNIPPKDDLPDGFTMLFGDFIQHLICENVVSALGKWCPALVYDIEFRKKLVRRLVLIERVRFDLVDHRLDPSVVVKVICLHRVKV